jgi:hypothetical protein
MGNDFGRQASLATAPAILIIVLMILEAVVGVNCNGIVLSLITLATISLALLVIYLYMKGPELLRLSRLKSEIGKAHAKRFISKRLISEIGGPFAVAFFSHQNTGVDTKLETSSTIASSDSLEMIPIVGTIASAGIAIKSYALDEEVSAIKIQLKKITSPAMFLMCLIFFSAFIASGMADVICKP